MNVTNKEIYDAVNGLRKELADRIEVVEKDVKDIDNWRNRVVGQFSIIMIVVGAGINWLFSFLPQNK